MTDLRIQVLGPSALWRGEHRLDLGPAGQRAAFGLLVLAYGRALCRNDIAAGLWPERPPPPAAANIIQTYVKHLRRLLEPNRAPRSASAALRNVADGYVLHVPDADVDAVRFRRQVAEAAAAQRLGRLDRAAESLADALALWHGPPLADIPSLYAHPKVVALTTERHEALARYGEVMIASGRPADGLAALEEAAAGQPLNEAWQARLMRAYQAAGRRSQAFATYHQVRRHLADDLGIDPGAELAAAHTALLHSDEHTATPVPLQLPADIPAFTGRAAELSWLDSLVPGSYARATVAVVSGTPGVGKTALVVHWAYRNASRFSDGQLYLNLHGFDPDGAVMEPGEAMRSMLESLGLPGDRVPTTVDGRAARYRSLLAGRRMLIVLDNARDVAQVRPLLPGAPGCLVLVTARHQLAGLVATEGAYPLRLEPLAPNEAKQLLVHRVGSARTAAEPVAAAEVLDRCAGLPLALVILASRVALNGSLPLAVLAEQLRRRRDRLDALSTGDPGTDLRAVFSWSYDALEAGAARLFRLMGLHAGPDISVAAAASLAALAVPETRRLLADLVRAGLAAESGSGRYSQHDLVRTYAADVAAADPARTRRAAVRRLLDHYLHSACAADHAAHPVRPLFEPAPPACGVAAEAFAEEKEALQWFADERAVLVATIERAACVSPRHAWQLARSLWAYLDLRGHWDDLACTQRIAVAAAGRGGDLPSRAEAHRRLARAYTRLHRIADAHRELRCALALYAEAADPVGRGHIHLDLALMCEREGRYAESLSHARRGLETFLSTGETHGIARARNSVGWYHALLGEYREALKHCNQAVKRLKQFGDRAGQAATWDSIGYARHHLGEYAESVAAYRRSLRFYREVGDRHLEGFVLMHLGDAYASAGDRDAAYTAWRAALDILERYDPPEADKLRTRLPAADSPRDPVAIQSASSQQCKYLR